ncbi:MAG: hypothetical protein KGI27_06215 [Thaumarchaeota archaeon]|nr:hypothetical protein [Nitrososphaerota archaeon]
MNLLYLAIIVGIGICAITTAILLPSFLNTRTRIYKIQPPNGLVLSNDEKQELINEALNVTGIQEWSNQWQFVGMGFSGKNENGSTHWNAIVMLKLPPDAKSPYPCDTGWIAQVQINLDTKQVENAWYPTLIDHQCHGNVIGQPAKNVK